MTEKTDAKMLIAHNGRWTIGLPWLTLRAVRVSLVRLTLMAVTLILYMQAQAIAGEWKQAVGPWRWSFPMDYGAHPEYLTEWWYFTGNLRDKTGKQYGYQLTFFRQGVALTASQSENSWSIRDVYLAHFALVDVSLGKFRYHDRAFRTGPGLAGAKTGSMNVWVLDWSAKMVNGRMRLHARQNEIALDLELSPRKAIIFHGEQGLSKKGPHPGQSSYYYSFTDLATRGTISTGSAQQTVEVTGTSWFDHEFGSNQLTPDQIGWDWFGIHLSDGRDLMIYFIRKKDGTIEPASSGTIIEKDGASRYLCRSEIALNVPATWKSSQSGGVYPAKWQIKIPSAKIDITLSPLVANQELVTKASIGITYWEGTVTGTGKSRGIQVNIEGYVELTGYAGSMGGVF